MADYIGRLVYEITGDTSGMSRSLGEAKGSASLFSTFMGGWAIKVAGIIGSAFAIHKLVDWNKKMLEAASAANETSSRFGGTFATAIGKANAAVAELTSQYGFSTRAAQDAMSATGGLVKTLGATDEQAAAMAETVAKLGADMASYVNYAGGAQGAADALTRAMLGETDAAKGLSLSLGDEALSAYARSLGKSVDSLNSVEKAQLRLNLAMSQASAMGAVGDMIRTATGYANTLRAVEGKIEDAQAKAGQLLIPAVTELTREFGNAIAPGGAFSGVLDTIAEAGATAAGSIAKLLAKLNQVGLQDKKFEVSSQLYGAGNQMTSLTNQINNFYGGIEKAREKAKGKGDDARNAKSLVAQYDRLNERVKELTALNKQLQSTDNKNALADMYKEADKAATKARDSFTIATNAIQDPDIAGGKFTRMTINQIAEMNAVSAADKYMKARAKDALAEYNEEMAKSAKLYEKADEASKKFGATIPETDGDSPPKKPTRLAPTSGKPTGSGKTQSRELEEQNANWKNINYSVNQYLAAIGVAPIFAKSLTGETEGLADEYSDLEKQIYAINEAMQFWGDAGANVLSGLAAATSAYYESKLAGLDAQMQAELEAAGVAEETAVEKAQKEYDAAVKSGDQTAIAEKKKALTKAKIEEEYDKKRSNLEFKAAMRAWELQVAVGAAEIPRAIAGAIATGMSQGGPYVAAAYAAIAAVSEGLQYAAILQSKPQRSGYAEGGVVPGSYYTGDKVAINVNSGERVLTASQNRNLETIANGAQGGGGVTHVHFHVGDKEVQTVVLAGLYDATANGEAMVHPNGIAKR